MAKELNIKKRILGTTPVFFKRIIKIALTLSVAAGALLTAPQVIDGFVLSDDIIKYAQWAVVVGIVAASVSKTTVEK